MVLYLYIYILIYKYIDIDFTFDFLDCLLLNCNAVTHECCITISGKDGERPGNKRAEM